MLAACRLHGCSLLTGSLGCLPVCTASLLFVGMLVLDVSSLLACFLWVPKIPKYVQVCSLGIGFRIPCVSPVLTLIQVTFSLHSSGILLLVCCHLSPTKKNLAACRCACQQLSGCSHHAQLHCVLERSTRATVDGII